MEFTPPSDEIKKFFKENDSDIKKYETYYYPERGEKEWKIFTSKGVTTFTQKFDFRFFKKK